MSLRPRSARIADKAGPFIAWTVVAVLLLLLTVLAVNGCKVTDGRAREVLEKQGFTNIDLGGASWLSCDRFETSREFIATNSAGKRVSGTVCCGVFGKACTVRW